MVFAFRCGMLGYVTQPQLVRSISSEVPTHQVVMDRWAGTTMFGASFRE